MINRLERINRSAWFWMGLIVLALALEAGALYYQYIMDYPPCVLCVHVRAWVLAILVAALLGLFLRHSKWGLVLANALTLGAALGMLERSYQTLGVEMGWVEGTCGNMQANFPSWLKLDEWLPAVFEPLDSCGMTPWLIPQFLSMAQGLVLIAGVLSVLLFIFLVASVFYRPTKPTH